MDSFARFLVAMGYPADRIRNPADGEWSYSSAMSSATLAGMLAWHYERDGMMPLLIGYSGGGMLVVRTLHELAGAFASHDCRRRRRRPASALPRDTIVDPATGRARPVLGLKVPYACALATGTLPRFLLGQWTMLAQAARDPRHRRRIHRVRDRVGPDRRHVSRLRRRYARDRVGARAQRRRCPRSYRHVDLPRTEHLAANPVTRAWIDAYRPDAPAPLPRRASTRRTCCTRPTSGTASPGTGAARRSALRR